MSDNQNEKEENVFPWKEKMRQAGQGDTPGRAIPVPFSSYARK